MAMFWSLVSVSLIFSVFPPSYGQELLTPERESSDNLYSTKNLDQQRHPISSLSPSCQQTMPAQSSICNGSLDYPSKALQFCNKKYYLTPCYCLLNDSNDTLLPLVGYCLFTCFKKSYLKRPNISSLLEDQCSPFNRTGKFCSECENGTAYPAYSFSLKCVPCEWNWRNAVKYVAVAYGPLTVFLVLLMAFRVSVNSAPLLGFIFVAQISSIPFQLQIGMGVIERGEVKTYQRVGIYILSSSYSIWNLDFFRSVIPPFCLHPHWTIVQIMSLDYIVSSYPFVVILVSYTIVEFYSRGYRICFWWKPFHRCFVQLRSGMNIKTSLIDAFGTFFSLSYTKTLSTTASLLAFTHTWNSQGHSEGIFPYYAAHLGFQPPYIALAIFFFLVFNILPIIVLFFYSLRQPPQEENIQGFFQPLLETLLTSYRDGKSGGRNCRFFCVVYLTARVIIIAAVIGTPNIFLQLVAAFILLIIGMLVAVIKPYKSTVYNTVDTVLMLTLALSYTSIGGYFFASFIAPIYLWLPMFFGSVVCAIPLLYILALVLYYVVWVSKLPQMVIAKFLKMSSGLKKLFKCLIVKVKESPQRERAANITSMATTYVDVESDTVEVINVDLQQ